MSPFSLYENACIPITLKYQEILVTLVELLVAGSFSFLPFRAWFSGSSH